MSSKKQSPVSQSNAASNVRMFVGFLGSFFMGDAAVTLFFDSLSSIFSRELFLLELIALLFVAFCSLYFFAMRPLNRERALRQANETSQHKALDHLNKITRPIPGMVFEYQLRPDGSACFPFASEAIREIFRLDPGDVLPETSKFTALIHPDDLAGFESSIKASACGLSAWKHEFRIQLPDCTLHWLSGNAIPERQSDGSTLLHGFLTDITERKALDELLHLHRTILDNLAEGIVLTRLSDETIVYTNPKFEQMFGYEPGGLIGKHVSTLNAPDKVSPADTAKEIISELLQTGFWSGRVRNIRKDGTPFWCRASVTSVDHPQFGQVWVSIHDDITERKQTEDNLRVSERRYRSLVENSPLCIHEIDLEGRLTSMNLAGLAMMETCDEAQVLGKPYLSAVHAEDYARIETLMIKAYAGKISHFEFKSRGLPQKIFKSCFVPSKNEHGIVEKLMGITEDITERKQQEAALQSSDEAYRSILETTLDGFCVADCNEKLVDVNERYAKQSGYTREELLTMSIPDLEAQETQEDTKYHFQHMMATGSDQFETLHRRKNGSVWHVEASITYLDANGGKFFGFLRDITERKAVEEKIKQLAFFDPLTQLPNRRMLDDRMAQMLAHCHRAGNLTAVCLLDLDGFKQVNDSLGHEAGDQLLREVATRLKNTVRIEDTVARLGGDEFVLVLGGFNKPHECDHTLARVVAQVAAPYTIAGKIARVSASIGVSLYPGDAKDADLLLRYADQSMYEAKLAGKNRYHLYDPTRGQRVLANRSAIDKIIRALEKNQIALYYQPIIDCRLGKVVAAETLLRWNHPVLGVLAASEFVPVIADDDAIFILGDWVMKNALLQMQEWQNAGLNIKISVNIFARQLHQEGFHEHFNELLTQHCPDSDRWQGLGIEIREITALENINVVSQTIRELRALGISVALDNFGVGYSSLVHLKRLPVTALKIDSSFIAQMLTDPQELAIVDGLINLATSFRLEVIAEGVESTNHLLLLKDLGCNMMQGYGIAHPMPAEKLSAWVKDFVPDALWSLPKSQRPSRDYFELLLAEANHPYWIEQAITESCESAEDKVQETLGDHLQCRFGAWYNSQSTGRLQPINEFILLDTLHKNVHETAVRLSEQRRLGNPTEAHSEETTLLRQQKEFTHQLRRLRLMLADESIGAFQKPTMEI